MQPQPAIKVISAEPASDGLAPGTKLGAYEIVKVIGRGGMGTVYEAFHSTIGRRVALKIIHEEYSRDTESLRRFFDEARAVNKIDHPSIIQITDLVEHPTAPFIVMELLRGQNLEMRIKDGPELSAREQHLLIDQLAGCLNVAHERGIIHRDLKPANIFLVGDEDAFTSVKLLDFGIAKLLSGPANGDMEGSVSGRLIGTPAYMSPEQVAGRPIDFRTDIYSFGVVLYETLTGERPFDGDSLGDFMIAHLATDPIPPRVHRPSLSTELEALIDACLTKDLDERLQSMEEVHGLGELAFREASLLVSPPARRSRLAVAAALVAVVGIALAVFWPEPAVRPERTPTVAAPVLFTLLAETTPDGALVFDAESGELLGRTPLQRTLNDARRPRSVRFEHAGFEAATRAVPTDGDIEFSLALTEVPAVVVDKPAVRVVKQPRRVIAPPVVDAPVVKSAIIDPFGNEK